MAQKRDESVIQLEELVAKQGISPAQLEKLAKTLRSDSAATSSHKKGPNKYLKERVVASTQAITKIFNKGKNSEVIALDAVDIQVHEGEIVALVGASGSGKSTLLNTMAGLEKPTSGSVTIDGKEITKLSDGALSDFRANTIGFVFQFFYLQPFLSLQRNIEVPLMFAGIRSKEERQQRSKELIELVGLSDRIDHRPSQLSGGQMQRVAIARALINRPRLIIADEPTGNLDSENARGVMDLFDQIRTKYGSSVLVVTHDSKIADRADRIIELEDGRIKHGGAGKKVVS